MLSRRPPWPPAAEKRNVGDPHGSDEQLALVHRIVENHRGEIRVEGRPGIGAAFTLFLSENATTDEDSRTD